MVFLTLQNAVLYNYYTETQQSTTICKQRNKLPCNKKHNCFRNKLQRQNSERLSEFGDDITFASECHVYSVSDAVVRYDKYCACLMKRLILVKLSNEIKINNDLADAQFGFKAGRSLAIPEH